MPQPTAQQLHDEIVADAATLGYKTGPGAWKEDGDIALLINQVRSGAAYQVSRVDINPSEILEAIDSRDFVASPAAALLSWFESVTQLASARLQKDDGTDTTVLANLKRLVNNTNLTQTRLNQLARRLGSRGEVLWGYGVAITPYEVAMARLIGQG
jgi:hypothetical protein